MINLQIFLIFYIHQDRKSSTLFFRRERIGFVLSYQLWLYYAHISYIHKEIEQDIVTRNDIAVLKVDQFIFGIQQIRSMPIFCAHLT